LLQGHITRADYDEQLLKESIPFRTIRATVAAKTALMNGFTAIRDLETEGAMYADIDVKHAIERGIILGRRARAGGVHHEGRPGLQGPEASLTGPDFSFRRLSRFLSLGNLAPYFSQPTAASQRPTNSGKVAKDLTDQKFRP
jgi:imidazolonepropionase-like amidohydrolase